MCACLSSYHEFILLSGFFRFLLLSGFVFRFNSRSHQCGDPVMDSVWDFSNAKQILLNKFALDRDAKIEELLYDTKLTSDLTPSELLTKMRDLIGDNQQKNFDLLRKLFLDQMPADARRLIAAAGEQDIDQIACIADRIVLEERRLSSRFHNTAVKSPPQRRYDDKPQSMQMHESALERQVTQLASAGDKLNTSVASLQPTKQTAIPYKHPAPTNNNRRPFSNSRPSDFSNTSRLYNASPVNAPPRDSDYPPNHLFSNSRSSYLNLQDEHGRTAAPASRYET